jgi:hypothetical protein
MTHRFSAAPTALGSSSELYGRASPGFPVELGGFGELHAPFFMERRTRGSLQCSVAGNPGPGLVSMAISAVSFLPHLAAGKLVAQDDDFVEWLKTWLGVQKARKDRKGHRLSG